MRQPSPIQREVIFDAFFGWLEDGGNSPAGILNRAKLPGTRQAVLRVFRDRQLVAAGQLIHPDGGYQQAVLLRAACQEFDRHIWHAWRKLKLPPDHANTLQELLFHGFRYSHLAGERRNGQPHTPGDWSLRKFRDLCAI